MISIADNLNNVRQRIKKAQTSSPVRLLAVSKTRTADEVDTLHQLGVDEFGENYLQEALEKIAALNAQHEQSIIWHFIGPIQSNKTRQIAEQFDWVQSVDREKIVTRLNEQRPDNLPPLNVCIQININDEQSKSGIAPEQLTELARQVSASPRLQLRGLMTIPAATQSDAELNASLNTMHNLFRNLQTQYPSVDTLSMGMSSDIEAAIQSGSTMVRVGTALFGPRTS
ncbi:TIM-barrel fold family protein [Oleiphilus messinensis]|uniref:Pyridoxal phosphate homeostasis protein n=1 Tax=Oleiphilus messinensis TaxID=141451 RepID=A0A1Y0I3F3_9GAMM|nr:YggS family pyridoxal phosphate-dependent enzyme [Oleiphilus messinensis]ARU55038.1 TIM-barrel fold family protein [Oleiphilus messinensis]